jgi:hypothetical protein
MSRPSTPTGGFSFKFGGGAFFDGAFSARLALRGPPVLVHPHGVVTINAGAKGLIYGGLFLLNCPNAPFWRNCYWEFSGPERFE